MSAPLAFNPSVLATVRLNAVRLYPAFMICPAMEAPITPVPIHPTRVLPGLISDIFSWAAVAVATGTTSRRVCVRACVRVGGTVARRVLLCVSISRVRRKHPS